MLLLICAACGSTPQQARRTLSMPVEETAKHRALARTGRRMYRALADARPQALLFDDLELRRLLTPQAASRAALLRATVDARLDFEPARFRALRAADYRGICVQNARVEPARQGLGLRWPGWVFTRALVVGARGEGEWVASWVEGVFVYTDAGFGALRLDRVEPPRWQHADLRLAVCDISIGLGDPPYIGQLPE